MASTHVAVADGGTVLCPDASIGRWLGLLEASRDQGLLQYADAAAGPSSGPAVTSPLVSNAGRAYRGRHRAVPKRSVGDRGRWLRLGVAAGLTALLVPVAGLVVPLISSDPMVMAQAGATPKPGSPGGNHSKPGDNKKKKKSDNKKKSNNNSNREGSSTSRGSGGDSGTRRSGSSFTEQTNANNRWSADGPNRSVNTRVSSQAEPPSPPQTQTQVIQAPPSQGRQSTTSPPRATAPATQTPPASQTPPVQQQVPPAAPPAQQATQTAQQPQAVAATAPAAPSNLNNTTTGLVIGLGAAAGAGLASRRNSASSSTSGTGVRVTPDNLAAALTNSGSTPSITTQSTQTSVAPKTQAYAQSQQIELQRRLATVQQLQRQADSAAAEGYASGRPVDRQTITAQAQALIDARRAYDSQRAVVDRLNNALPPGATQVPTPERPAGSSLDYHWQGYSQPAGSQTTYGWASQYINEHSAGLVPDLANVYNTATNLSGATSENLQRAVIDVGSVVVPGPASHLVGEVAKGPAELVLKAIGKESAEEGGRLTAAMSTQLLEHSEAAGGHLIERHVGQTTSELAARLASTAGAKGPEAVSTFRTLDEASQAVTAVLKENAATIQQWVKDGAINRLTVKGAFEGGMVLNRGAVDAVEGTRALVVLKGDGLGGWSVLTGFPTP